MLSTIKLFHQAEPFPQQKIYIHKIYQTFESINKEEIIYIYKSAKLQRDSRIGREKKASHKSGSKSLFSWHVTYLRPYRKLLFLFLFFSLAFFLLLSKFSCLHFRPTTFLRHTHPYLPPSILPPENLPFQEAEKQKFRTFLCLFSFLHFFFPVNPVHGYKEFQSTGEKNLMSGSFWALKMEENQRLLRLFFPPLQPTYHYEISLKGCTHAPRLLRNANCNVQGQADVVCMPQCLSLSVSGAAEKSLLTTSEFACPVLAYYWKE